MMTYGEIRACSDVHALERLKLQLRRKLQCCIGKELTQAQNKYELVKSRIAYLEKEAQNG